MKPILFHVCITTFLVHLGGAQAADIILNEIMYHPASGEPREEYVEIYNRGTNAVDLSGWRFDKGMTFVFPTNTTMPAGSYLVITADTNIFALAYPGVSNVVGGWVGRLRDSDENIELQDANGNVVNAVHYADEGDWAMRISGAGEMRILSLTNNGSTATAIMEGHYGNGDQVQIYGAEQPQYNGTFNISGVIDGGGALNNRPSTSFNFPVFGAPASPATGLIVCRQLTDVQGRGWAWTTYADGFGSSLELINPGLPNTLGQNWRASWNFGGTPGRANSVLNTNTAPVIGEVAHFPAIPRLTEEVSVTARIADEQTNGLAALVFYRDHTTMAPGVFSSVPMFDDGQHNDGAAGDGLYGATLPTQPNGTIIEFYVKATDAQGQFSSWPAQAIQHDGSLAQTANALYQVDDNLAPPSASTANQPVYRLIMTATERSYYLSLAGNSDAQMNGTFISSDADGIKVRYNVGIRTRGAGTRSRTPRGLRVNIPSDRRWNRLSEINFKTQFIHAQLAGHALAAKAGLPAAEARAMQLRVNGVNWAPSSAPLNGSENGAGWGTCLYLESFNADWADRLLPKNAGGNLYRGSKWPWNANLDYLGTNYLTYINAGYSKASNQGDNDWSDLFRLTWILNQIPTDADYLQAVRTNLNVELWMRYFALCNLLEYSETSLCNGVGDDYALYRGLADPRFLLLAHDFDTILGEGDCTTCFNTNASIWLMIDNPPSTATDQQANFLRRFLRHPEFAPLYLQELKRLCDTVFSPEQFNPLADQLLGGWVAEQTITNMKNFMAARRASVLAQIPQSLTATTGLGMNSGYFYTTVPEITIFGQANALETRRVVVNGSSATYSPWNGRWTNSVVLLPGINRLLVQSFDSNNVECARTTLAIWYDTGVGTTISGGTLNSSANWVAGSGPYRVTGSLTIGSGVTLAVNPGTTVFLSPGVNLTVANGGRLLATGLDAAVIHFGGEPGNASPWGGLIINGGVGSPETRLAYVHIEGNGSTAISSTGGTLWLEHLSFGTTNLQYLSLDNSSFVVSDCYFPSAAPGAYFELVHGSGGIKSGGRGIFQRNFFGIANSMPGNYNDVIDFTGGARPGPIVQFINNVFIGASDDHLDLDNTDAWIEGNIFLHAHKNGSPDTSSAISGGSDTGQPSRLTIIGNISYDCDHAALAKQGNFYTFLNNTIVRQTRQGGTDTEGAVLCLADNNMIEGAGAYFGGNIIYDAEQLTRNLTNALVTFSNNFLSLPWNGPGGENSSAYPLFQHLPAVGETTGFSSWSEAQVMREWLSLRSGSPARGTGPNGTDAGVPLHSLNTSSIRAHLGVLISGEPAGTTSQTTAALRVGANHTGDGISPEGWPDGAGYTHFCWRLDGGTWSAETPITTPIVLAGLATGPHFVEVRGRRDSGFYQDDLVYGTDTVVSRSRTWFVDPNAPGLRINEMLASNRAAVAHEGSYPDLVELYNAGTTSVDLSGMGLSDEPGNPFKFVFPGGLVLQPGDYLVLYADSDYATAGLHLGFAFAQAGGGVFLCNPAGQLVDSLEYGTQLTDLSVGRLEDGTRGLTYPTFGAANLRYPTGDPEFLLINEWLADGETFFRDDFVELVNLAPYPVELGGCFLSDNPEGWPDRHRIAPLTFIGGNGYFTFTADGVPDRGVDHLNFQLPSEQGMLGLFDRATNLIDCVYYEGQRPDISQGRSPSGASTITWFPVPTPNGANPTTGTITISNIAIPLLPMISEWRYDRSGVDLGMEWRLPDYRDSHWPSGLALLGVENAAMAYPLNTAFPDFNNAQPTYYFRTTFLAPTNLTGLSGLMLTTMLDDGAVIYLNGLELTRIRMPENPISYYTLATSAVGDAAPETLMRDSSLLLPGTNHLAVEVHQRLAPTSSDIVWGMALTAIRTITNVSQTTLFLNEVMANNESVTNADGTVTDWIEIYNPSQSHHDLAGLSLTDDPWNPTRWVFPPGAGIPAGGYLVVWCDPNAPASTNMAGPLNTGFGLKASGDRVYLFDRGIDGNAPAQVDGIAFGLQAPDFSLGRVPDGLGAWTLCLPTPEARNLAAALGNSTALTINEWMADPLEGDDWFELYNPNNQPVALGNLYLTDDLARRTKYRIPPYSYMSYGGRGFAVFRADSNPDAGADHTNFKLAREGESIGLFTDSGVVIDSITFELQAKGVSEGRLLDGMTNRVRFTNSASPGSANNLPLTQVVINEVLAHSDPPLQDAVELHNLSDEWVDISGWWLSDQAEELRKYRIPDGTVIEPQGYLVLYEYQFNPPPFFWPAFALSGANGDQIYVSQADATTGELTGARAVAVFGPSESGVSLGRYETSVGVDFVALGRRSFGMDTPATTNDFIQGTGLPNTYPKVGPIVISEIMYHPPNLGTTNNTADEYIELHNITSAPVPLYQSNAPGHTWHLREGVDFNFPTNQVVPPGGYVLVVNFNPGNTNALAAFRNRYGLGEAVPVFGPYQGNLANGGEALNLNKPDEPSETGDTPYVLVERIRYFDSAPWPTAADGDTNYPTGLSLQRLAAGDYGNDPVNWIAALPTPGAPNGGAVVAPPSITSGPADQVVMAGTNISFSVTTSGASPLWYQWLLNGAALAGKTNATLVITNAQPAQSGRYTVLVSNPSGAAVSTPATLIVVGAPEILQQPQDRAVIRGSTGTFAVSTRGYGLYFQWRLDGTPILEATNSVLIVNNVQTNDAGGYDVLVWNTISAVTSSVARLSVLLPPEILLSPQDAMVVLSNAAIFTVLAQGTPPLFYQWRFNGVDLPRATNAVLEIPSVLTNHDGLYDVRLWNSIGCTTSGVARLTVVVPPTVTVVASGLFDTEPGFGRGRFTFMRSGPPTNDLSVSYTITGSATPGQDYQALPTTVVIPRNFPAVELPVQVLDDSLRETPETITITLVAGEYLVGTQFVASVTILDNENQPPTIAITNPPDGVFYPEIPAMVLLQAEASDPDGTVTQVEFFNGTNKLGEVRAAPFSLLWSNPPAGTNVLTAIATDDLEAKTISAPVKVIINLAPIITITDPTNNSVFEAPLDLLLQAAATDADGSVSSVTFYNGTNLLGEASGGPNFWLVWSNVPIGNYLLTAVAMDDWGLASTSSAVRVSVVKTNFADLFVKRGELGGFTNFLTGNNSAATSEPGEPAPFSGTGTQTLWISWTAPTNGWCTVDTLGSTFDTVLSVYTNNPPNLPGLTNLMLVGGDDDDGGDLASLFTFYAQAGTVYHIRVAGFSSEDTGSFQFHLSLAIPTSVPSTPNLVSVQAVSSSQVNLRWIASTNQPDGYQVEQSATGVGFMLLAQLEPTATEFPVTRLTPSTTYYYRVRAFNRRGNSAYSDTRSCTLPSPVTMPFHVRIDFAPGNAPVPLGWEPDNGGTFRTWYNALSYGWNADNTWNGLVTGSGASPYDSFLYLERSGSANTWEIAVPASGYYLVRLAAGSAAAEMDFYSLTVEDTLALYGPSSGLSPFVESTTAVWVSDGRLTITAGPDSLQNRLALVEIRAAVPPQIVVQPLSQAVALASAVRLEVEASGTAPLGYQWYKEDVAITGATNALLAWSGISALDIGAYKAVISSPYGSVTSVVAVLSTAIRADDLFEDFEPGLHPEEWSRFSGTAITTNWGGQISGSHALWFGGDAARWATTRPLNTSAGGVVDFQLRLAGGNAAPWEAPELPGEGIILEYSTDNQLTWLPISSYRLYTFTNWTHLHEFIPPGAQTPFTFFRWRQMSHSDDGYDHWALDDVLVLVSTNQAPVIRSEPSDQTGLVGTRTSFSVGVVGSWPLTYQWRFNGTVLPSQTNSTLVLDRVTAYHAGLYSVVASNPFGTILSREAQLYLDFGMTTNAMLIFGITNSWRYYQNGPLGAEWSGTNYNDISWPPGRGLLAQENDSRITPYINTWLILGQMTYYFRTRFLVPTLPTGAQVVGLLTSNLVDDGAVFYLNGTELSPRLRLPVGGINYYTPAENVVNEAVYDVIAFTNQPVPGTNLLAVEVHQSSSSSSDIVFGMALSALFTMPNSLPVIVAQPQSQSVLPGTTVTFTVNASGTPTPSYQWYFNGNSLPGRTASSFIIPGAQLAQAGEYFVLVSNPVGVITSSVATLTVRVPPFLLSQPHSQTVFAGTNVILSVTVMGAQPLFYEWSRNGSAIPNQTNNLLILESVLPSQSGSYSVTVTNNFGRASSSTAVLTVLGPSISASSLLNSNGTFRFTFNGFTGGQYFIECSSNLHDWAIMGVITNSGNGFSFLDTSGTNSSRFYRLNWSP